MRVLLVSLNAKYVHTNLALRYLREEIIVEFPDIRLLEFTINQSAAHIAGEIFEAKADVIGFSCYIWNLVETLAVIRRLRQVCPAQRFVLGGPEVSYETVELMENNPGVDAVVIGEGERTFLELLRAWDKGRDPGDLAGVAWRKGGELTVNREREPLQDLVFLPDPYTQEESFNGRIVYLETMRGCPFSCQYCLSSRTHGVRFLPPARFRQIFRSLLQTGVKTIKFVDRTFNTNKVHAFQILDIVREETINSSLSGSIRVHCEMAGELLDEEWLEYLRAYPPGLLQLEIGVQSTHQSTLEIIRRTQNFQNWQGYIRELVQATQIPIHLDLIAGLPKEDWSTFRQSFNDVYDVEPNLLQLGFLKLLKGSGLRLNSVEYGLVYAPDPPYTILQTDELSYSELLRLSRIEELLNQYYNSGRFVYSLRYILTSGVFASPFDFYQEFAEFWQEREWFSQHVQGKALLQRFWEFAEAFRLENLREALLFDYYLWERPGMVPEFLRAPDLSGSLAQLNREVRNNLFRDPLWRERIPEMTAMDRRQWARLSAVEFFTLDILANSKVPGQNEVEYLFLYLEETKVFRI
ncbi:MAG: B12-binding domain-containing radical SAM protein [Desulfitobacteriaceae bacterium]